MNYKKAIEIVLNWPSDHEEIMYPEIHGFLIAIMANDKNAWIYAHLKKKNESETLTELENQFVKAFEKKYNIFNWD